MSSAFYVPESAGYKLNGKRVVLIDDIYTTGSTLEACAGELKKPVLVKYILPAFALVEIIRGGSYNGNCFL